MGTRIQNFLVAFLASIFGAGGAQASIDNVISEDEAPKAKKINNIIIKEAQETTPDMELLKLAQAGQISDIDNFLSIYSDKAGQVKPRRNRKVRTNTRKNASRKRQQTTNTHRKKVDPKPTIEVVDPKPKQESKFKSDYE